MCYLPLPLPNFHSSCLQTGSYGVFGLFWPYCMACGILVPWPGIEPCFEPWTLHWKHGVLTTGPVGKFLGAVVLMHKILGQEHHVPCVSLRVRVHTKSLQSCPTLCDPMDCNPQGSLVHGILQQGYCNGLPRPPPGELPYPGIKPLSLGSQVLYHYHHLGSPL